MIRTALGLGLVFAAAMPLRSVAHPSHAAPRAAADEAAVAPERPLASEVPAALRFTMNSLAGEPVDLARYAGKVVLVVNVASRCGLTPQYEGLQALHEKYAEAGLAILGFPANNFGGQEPGTDEQIAEFCQKNFGVSFDMFSKISVLGDDQAPLYRHLTTAGGESLAGDVKWNFEKFLIGRDGTIVHRFRSRVAPGDPEVVKAIETALAQR